MPRSIGLALLLIVAATSFLADIAPGQASSQADKQATPQWIWCRNAGGDSKERSDGGEVCRLERAFSLAAPVRSATVRLAADFCQATVAINDRSIVSVEPFSPTVDLDVTALLRGGENRIAILAQPSGGPAAVALSLSLTLNDGSSTTLLSDGQWRASRGSGQAAPAVPLGAVEPALWGFGSRPATIDPFDNYEQWRQAIGTPATANQAAFWTAPGFAISLVRQAQPDEGSWVSMAFDPQGRLTIAREDQGLLRMTLNPTRNSIERVEAINSDLKECRGLLYAYDALYASANNSKGLYRLRDTNGDEQFDDIELLREFPGNVGHGRNDLALGPDGMIYAIHGDAVDVPKENIVDFTSPFREARRGKTTREGFVLRTDRNAQRWELVAAGLRNPFGIAFNLRGDLFTYDADAEFDMGSPWYRPTRIDQLVSGADFGWRGVTGKWPPYFPDHADNALPTLDIGKGSPTAVAFGTKTNFPPDYRRALFVLDWAYGRVLAVHLAPRGAGYRARAETFLKGRPLNVTDLAVGPDGALYLITGGRKTQSALYRVAYTGRQVDESPSSPHDVACAAHADAMRRLRLELEGRHRPLGPSAVEFAWPNLDSPDPLIRYAARTAVEHQPLETWRERALSEQRTTASLTALLALARSGEQGAAASVIDRLIRFAPQELSLGQNQMLMQAYFVCLGQSPADMMQRKDAIVRQLDPIFPYPGRDGHQAAPTGTGASLNRDLARLLAELGAPSIIEKASQSLLASAEQEDRLQGLFVLRNLTSGWTDRARRAYFTALDEASTSVGGEGMPKFLAQIREQAVATLADRERLALFDLLAPRESRDEPLPPPRALVKHWTLDDLEPSTRDSPVTGDPVRGETVFRDALCARCHRAGARGPAVGPDLTHVAGRFSRRDILESILSPSKVVAENYRNVQIITIDGRQLVGRVLLEGDFRSEKLRIATEPLGPSTIVEISKRDIDQVREAETSPMPQGLLDSFSRDEILDLLAFLERGEKRF
jgi:putative heme-binding domain-containing protein